MFRKKEIVQQNENHVYAHYFPEFVGLKRKEGTKIVPPSVVFLNSGVF